MNIEKKLRNKIGKAIVNQKLIDENDNILVAISGGKDSWVLFHFLYYFQKVAPINFNILPFVLDIGFDKSYLNKISNYFRDIYQKKLIIESVNMLQIIEEEAKNIDKKKSPCMLCSRIRRGRLYKYAIENNFNKLALGHHADDLIETFFMNMFYNSELKTMPPRLIADNKEVTVIRPMYLVYEDEIKKFVKQNTFIIEKPHCPYDETQSTRYEIKLMINKISKNTNIKSSILKSFHNVNIGHLIDRKYADLTENIQK